MMRRSLGNSPFQNCECGLCTRSNPASATVSGTMRASARTAATPSPYAGVSATRRRLRSGHLLATADRGSRDTAFRAQIAVTEAGMKKGSGKPAGATRSRRPMRIGWRCARRMATAAPSEHPAIVIGGPSDQPTASRSDSSCGTGQRDETGMGRESTGSFVSSLVHQQVRGENSTGLGRELNRCRRENSDVTSRAMRVLCVESPCAPTCSIRPSIPALASAGGRGEWPWPQKSNRSTS